ncbi:unnamed protein product [Allacma fusca]|uniref:MYND-type domain-containing protein n=1 Tax=Allacma fusca TaxID=39272 RepID=A0A8J2P7U7_9HEXA|nr:unnamed protein product [Allacma fusca]
MGLINFLSILFLAVSFLRHICRISDSLVYLCNYVFKTLIRMTPETSDENQDTQNSGGFDDGTSQPGTGNYLERKEGGKRSGEKCDFPNCSSLAEGSCPSCKLVGYCSDYHRHLDWNDHRSSCSKKFLKEKISLTALRSETDILETSKKVDGSITSLSSESAAEGSACYKSIVANTDIKSGSRIIIEEPAVSFPNFEYALPGSRSIHTAIVGMTHFIAPSEDFKEYYYSELLDTVQDFYPVPKVAQVCFGCYAVRENGLFWDCKRCGVPLCSELCEDSDNHKFQECRAIQDINLKAGYIHWNVEALYMDIATLRTLMIGVKCIEKFKRILDLVNHPRVENYKKSAKYSILLAPRHMPFVLPLSMKFSADHAMVTNICCIVDALSGVYSSDPYPSKKSLYTFCASLQHECVPNCLFTPYFKNFEPTSEIVLIASSEIKEGEALTIDVLNKPLYISRQDRRILLRRKCVFVCYCAFCSDPTDGATFLNALRCDRGHCPDYILSSDPIHYDSCFWTCQKCGEISNWKDIAKKLQEWREAVISIPIQYDNLGKFSTMKHKLMQQFHPNHYLVLAVEGIQAKLVLGPKGHAWGGMKILKHDPRWLDAVTLKEYYYIRQYCYQSLRFLRVANAVNRALMLSQLFYIEFLLALRKLHRSNVNLNMEFINFRMQLARLKESSDIFLKHFHPSRLFIGNKTKNTLQMFDKCILLFQIFNRRQSKHTRKWARVSSESVKIPPVQFDKIFKPILEAFLTPDPINENLLL